MMKFFYHLLLLAGSSTVPYGVSKVDNRKFEAVMETNRLGIVRSLLKA
jgi:hypothetical protein